MTMFRTIFVAVDGDGHGPDALRLARYLAGAETEFVLGPLTSTAGAVDAAHAEHADVIVMGSARDAVHVLHGSPVPIAVAPGGFADGPEDRLRVIGVGFDGQPESRAALKFAEQLATEHEATMRVYAVVLPNPMTSSRVEPTPEEYRRLISESLEGQLRDEIEQLDSGLRAAASVRRGDATETLVAATSEGLDLLVLGSRGYGPLRRVLFGSVSSRVLGRAACPVLVLPRQVAEGGQPGLPDAGEADQKLNP
jgi:nucleotide-binding universal stress UspA family protein